VGRYNGWMAAQLNTGLEQCEQRVFAEFQEAVLLIERVADLIRHPDRAAAEELRAEGSRRRQRCREIEADLITLTACHAPLAEDLRTVVTLMHLAQHGGLIANQFRLMGEQLAAIDAPGRRSTSEALHRMALLAAEQLEGASRAIGTRDPTAAAGFEDSDDAIDALNRRVFAEAHELEVDPEERELALRHVLVARSLERIGDNAVKIAEHARSLSEPPEPAADGTDPQ
jgi:phosphate transport system protein